MKKEWRERVLFGFLAMVVTLNVGCATVDRPLNRMERGDRAAFWGDPTLWPSRDVQTPPEIKVLEGDGFIDHGYMMNGAVLGFGGVPASVLINSHASSTPLALQSTTGSTVHSWPKAFVGKAQQHANTKARAEYKRRF